MEVVLLDTTLDSSDIGGGHLYLPKLIKGLVRRGIKTHLVTKGVMHPKIAGRIETSGASIHSRLWGGYSPVNDTAPKLAKWLNDLRPDVFVVSSSTDVGWVVLPLLDPKIATAAVAHSNIDAYYVPVRHYRDFLTMTVGVSHEICNNLVRKSGMEESRVAWIPYGVHALECAPSEPSNEERIELVYVGRLEEAQKRASDLISLIKGLEKRQVKYRFTIVGDGSLMPRFKQELRVEAEKGHVVLCGWLADEGVLEQLRKSDVFILTSDSEGFSIAVTEAAGNGCCLVITDIPSGNQQLVRDGENGFLIPVGDVDKFVERIEFLSRNTDVLLKMRSKSWEIGRNYHVDRMVASYIEHFEHAVHDSEVNRRRRDDSFPLMPTCRSRYPLWMRRIKAKIRPRLDF